LLTLVEERIDPRLARVYAAAEAELAAGAPPLEAARRFVSMLRDERDAILLLIDFWSQAVRDASAAERFAERHARLRAVIARLLEAAAGGGGTDPAVPPEHLATTLIALANGFAIELLADPDSVPDDLFGQAVGALIRGSRASA
jgi:hypothetical protein